ncbi:hypothetical protein MXB_3145 [Myxobolus squamalis]|nr:hypothetical protein MXB_3145 [Myxobolus squamalis]
MPVHAQVGTLIFYLV